MNMVCYNRKRNKVHKTMLSILLEKNVVMYTEVISLLSLASLSFLWHKTSKTLYCHTASTMCNIGVGFSICPSIRPYLHNFVNPRGKNLFRRLYKTHRKHGFQILNIAWPNCRASKTGKIQLCWEFKIIENGKYHKKNIFFRKYRTLGWNLYGTWVGH